VYVDPDCDHVPLMSKEPLWVEVSVYVNVLFALTVAEPAVMVSFSNCVGSVCPFTEISVYDPTMVEFGDVESLSHVPAVVRTNNEQRASNTRRIYEG
jgi:hypothetical protein